MPTDFVNFEPEMMVDFSAVMVASRPYFALCQREQAGPGPYRVTKVESIFEKCPCTCGAGEGELRYYQHADECEVKWALKCMGHHQWVTIQTKAGEKRFSGEWLAIAG